MNGMIKVCIPFALMMTLILACNVENKSKDIENGELNVAFGSLYLIHNSPDFPGHPSAFKACLQHKNNVCFKVIELVRKAILQIKMSDHASTLNKTINTIIEYCIVSVRSQTTNDNERICEGALTALYFFNKQDDNKKILDELKKLDKDTNKIIFDRNKAWYYNRKNVSPWLKHTQAILTGFEQKVQLFRFNQKNIRAFGLMLFEKPIPDGDNLTY